MDEEDDDQRLLHSFGVTSANIEDIEKKLLSQVETEPKRDDGDEPGAAVDDPSRSNAAPESDAQAKLHQKLRSVQLEIDAVASTIKRAKNAAAGKEIGRVGQDKKKQKQASHTAQDEPRGGALQQALATERLKSLKKAKVQIQKEISQSDSSGSGNRKDKMLAMLVAEEPR